MFEAVGDIWKGQLVSKGEKNKWYFHAALTGTVLF